MLGVMLRVNAHSECAVTRNISLYHTACVVRPSSSASPRTRAPLRHRIARARADSPKCYTNTLDEMLQCCLHKSCIKKARVLDVLSVKDDTLEQIIERIVVLLQVNVVVYIHLNADC
jgi:hypothetical protein